MRKALIIGSLFIALGFMFNAPVADAGGHCQGKQCSLSAKAASNCSKSQSKSQCEKACSKKKCPILSKVMKKACFLKSNADEIGLSEEQVAKIKSIKATAKKAAINHEAQMKVFEIDIKQMLYQKPIDQNAINAMLDQAAAGWGQGAKESVQWYIDLKSVLSDKQMEKAKEIWKRDN